MRAWQTNVIGFIVSTVTSHFNTQLDVNVHQHYKPPLHSDPARSYSLTMILRLADDQDLTVFIKVFPSRLPMAQSKGTGAPSTTMQNACLKSQTQPVLLVHPSASSLLAYNQTPASPNKLLARPTTPQPAFNSRHNNHTPLTPYHEARGFDFCCSASSYGCSMAGRAVSTLPPHH